MPVEDEDKRFREIVNSRSDATTASASELEASMSAHSIEVARIGVGLLMQHHISQRGSAEKHALADPKEVHQAVHEALRSDSRVSHIDPLPEDTNYMNLTFAAGGERRDGTPTSPHTHVHAVQFRDPIVFSVRIARRLQGSGRGVSEVPSEEYWVAWNGVELLVAWKPEEGYRPHGHAGGFAVLDVLRECVKIAGYGFKAQSCSPSCNYPFSHQDLELKTASVESSTFVEDLGGSTLRVVTAPAPGDAELVRRIASSFEYITRVFARLRSHGLVVSTAERSARKDLGELLELQVEQAQVASSGVFRSLGPRWKNRHLRKNSSALIASLWLKLATLDQQKRQWDEFRYLFDRSRLSNGGGLLFRSEYEEELHGVSGLDVENLRAAVSQMTTRADSWGVVTATAGGAILGGIVGAVVGGLFTVLWGAG